MSSFSRQSFRSIFCAFNRHEPRRGAVRWDGVNYVAACNGCGKDIRRHGPKQWREDPAETAQLAD
ncbi:MULTISPECIES: hypothetical protein [Sphingomonadaceae]|uniref:Uncharacterized protein n=1 Tax=Novosphingobium clariflavum TaxID=2029884 RepID=A0ABV6S828_9SPHN|nr:MULTISPECIES: hypothetical protein [Sphingomonadaceae]